MTSIQNTEARRPDPTTFGDYRVYLRAMIDFLRVTQRGFSFRQFSRRAGYSSPNFLQLVAQGKRNISVDSIARFAKGLGLSAREHEAFEALVHLGQASTDEERNRHYRKLRAHGSTSPARAFSHDQYDVYSLWYALPIREMMLLPEFREDPTWIASQIRPRIRVAEARRALELLESTGLASRDGKGRLVPASAKMTTPPVVHSLAVRNFHRSMLERATETLDRVPVAERDVTSLTLSLTAEEYREVCERIGEIREELLDRIEDRPKTAAQRRVYVAAFQVFPVTHSVSPKEQEP